MIVREALVADPLVLQGDAPARAAAAVLVKPHVTSVLVADGDRLLGSVTEEAIVAAVAQDRDLRSLPVSELADADVATVSQLRDVPGMLPDRAPVIVAGAVVVTEALRHFGLTELTVSERDLMHGAALAAAELPARAEGPAPPGAYTCC